MRARRGPARSTRCSLERRKRWLLGDADAVGRRRCSSCSVQIACLPPSMRPKLRHILEHSMAGGHPKNGRQAGRQVGGRTSASCARSGCVLRLPGARCRLPAAARCPPRCAPPPLWRSASNPLSSPGYRPVASAARRVLRVRRRPWLSTEWHNTAKVMLAGAGTTARTLDAECAYQLPRGRFHTLAAVGMLSRQGLVFYATRRAHDIFEEDAAGCVVAHGNGRARIPVGQEVPDLVIVDFDVAHLPRHVYLVLCAATWWCMLSIRLTDCIWRGQP